MWSPANPRRVRFGSDKTRSGLSARSTSGQVESVSSIKEERPKMVWVIKGNLNSTEEDSDSAVPQPTAHYLRPQRIYRVGRGPAWQAKGKEGKQVQVRTKLDDFRIRSLTISGGGQWKLITGEWDDNDVRDEDGSRQQYSLTFRPLGKKAYAITRQGVRQDYAGQDSSELMNGDTVHFGAGRFNFFVTWQTLSFWTPTPKSAKDKAVLKTLSDLAKAAGVKIVSTKPANTEYTHALLATIKPGLNPSIAAAKGLRITTTQFALDLLSLTTLPPRPNPADLPELSVPSDPTSTAELSLADERALVAVDGDIGRDWRRYWGHSALEKNWDVKPTEEDYRSAVEPGNKLGWTSEGWDVNEGRKTIMKDLTVVAFGKMNDLSEIQSALVNATGGRFFLSPVESLAHSPGSIVEALKSFEQEQGGGESRKYAIIPPSGDSFHFVPKEGAEESDEGKNLREIAKRLKVTRYLVEGHLDLIQAIYHVDRQKCLLGPPFDESLYAVAGPGGLLPPESSGLPAFTPTPGPTPTPTQTAGASTFASVPGTHPEEETIQPVRKLTRRAKTQRPPRRWDDMDEDGNLETQATGAGKSRDPHTQVEANELTESPAEAEPTTKPKLKRRAGTQRPRSPSPTPEVENDGTQPASSLYDFNNDEEVPAKRSKKNQASDDDESQDITQVKKLQRGKAELSVVEEEADEDGTGPSTSRGKKRAASEAVSEGEGSSALTKRRTRATSEQVEETPSPAPIEKAVSSKKNSAASAIGKGGKKGKAANKEIEDDGLLRMKTIKRKGAEVDQGFNDDFNALKIVKPVMIPMKAPERHKMRWGEVDAEEERERLIREDAERMDHPDDWVPTDKSFFIVEYMDLSNKVRTAPNLNDVELEEKYAGRPNFKKFRPKNATVPIRARRASPEFVVPDVLDLGMGAAYKPSIKIAGANSQRGKQRQIREDDSDDDEDDDDMRSGGQKKLNFGASKAKTAAKGKQKAKRGVIESDESDEDAHSSSGTLHQDEMNVDSSSQTPTLTSGSRPKSKTKAPPAKANPKSNAAPAPTRRRAVETLVIDSDSDDDDGRTFAGFNNKRKR